MKSYYILLIAIITCSFCHPLIANEDPETSVEYGTLIFKPFVKKNGEATKIPELYFQVDDTEYFIKRCENHINEMKLVPYYKTGVHLEIEIREGEWDICDGNFEQQSRIGTYIIIHKIVLP